MHIYDLNILNDDMQGKNEIILTSIDNIIAFNWQLNCYYEKLENFREKYVYERCDNISKCS